MRNTHPTLYKTYLAYGLLTVALGLNFVFLTPAFMPLSASKWVVGNAFLACGFINLLILLKTTTWLRLSMMLSVALYAFWAGALTVDFFRLSQTSMQLPLTYFGLAALGIFLLTEPFVNPATQTNGTNGTAK